MIHQFSSQLCRLFVFTHRSSLPVLVCVSPPGTGTDTDRDTDTALPPPTLLSGQRPHFPAGVMDHALPLRRADRFPGARKMIDEYFEPWASPPAGCPFYTSPPGLGSFSETRKCHFYGYHPGAGTVRWGELLWKWR